MEHVIAALFAIGFPASSTPTYAKRRAAMLAGDRSIKRREYLETIAWLSSMGLASVGYFVLSGRPLGELGLTLPTSRGGIAAVGLAVLGSCLLWLQLRAVRTDEKTRELAREAMMPVREYFPTRADERGLFRGVSFSAGIGEELFYRGFLMWYLATWFPLWAVVVLSSILFGLAHVMHGVQATLRSTVSGLVLAGLYLLGGSLLAPMILHTMVDLTSGESGAFVFREDASPASGPSTTREA